MQWPCSPCLPLLSLQALLEGLGHTCSRRCKQKASPLIWYSLIDRILFHTLVRRTLLMRKQVVPDVNNAPVLGVRGRGEEAQKDLFPTAECSLCRA